MRTDDEKVVIKAERESFMAIKSGRGLHRNEEVGMEIEKELHGDAERERDLWR